jgi:hypothetical protein
MYIDNVRQIFELISKYEAKAQWYKIQHEYKLYKRCIRVYRDLLSQVKMYKYLMADDPKVLEVIDIGLQLFLYK